jgi:tetratricopeptide (TPR) repeat protein
MAAASIAAGPARADEMAEAKEHFKKGQTHYALGEFNEAVAEFRDAYRLRDEPAILFNIAQAMRQLGQFKQAHFYYSQYLARRPEATNRADVEQFMVQMRRKADAEEEADRLRRAAEAARAPAAQAQSAHAIDAPAAPGGEGPGSADPGISDAGAPGRTPAAIVAALPTNTGSGGGMGPGAGPPESPSEAGAPVSGSAASPAGPGAAPLESLRPGPAPAWTARRVLRYSGFGAIGAGVVAEGLALLFHASAQASADEFSRRYQSGTLQPADAALRDNVSSKGRLSTIAAVSGAVLVAAGVAVVLAF